MEHGLGNGLWNMGWRQCVAIVLHHVTSCLQHVTSCLQHAIKMLISNNHQVQVRSFPP